jgi:TatD DNase family protein
MMDILQVETEKGAFPAILHCFSSGQALAEKGVELGLMISFSGILTFKNSEEIRNIARNVPFENLLVETDAPFLAPVPLRGKRNEPSHVVNTARVLAEVKGVSEEEIHRITTNNFFSQFTKVPKPKELA